MNLLPIVPGCRAIFLPREPKFFHEAGKNVLVINLSRGKHGRCDICDQSRWWVVDGDPDYVYCEHALMRIDGNDDQFRKEVARSQKPRQCVKASMD